MTTTIRSAVAAALGPYITVLRRSVEFIDSRKLDKLDKTVVKSNQPIFTTVVDESSNVSIDLKNGPTHECTVTGAVTLMRPILENNAYCGEATLYLVGGVGGSLVTIHESLSPFGSLPIEEGKVVIVKFYIRNILNVYVEIKNTV